MIWLVVSADSAVVVSALSWEPLSAATCETVKAAMSVVFSVAIVVVDRLAICAFDSELMNDVIANPQSAHFSRRIRARIIIEAPPPSVSDTDLFE